MHIQKFKITTKYKIFGHVLFSFLKYYKNLNTQNKMRKTKYENTHTQTNIYI